MTQKHKNRARKTDVTLREWWSRRQRGWWSSAMAEAPAMVEERREEKRRARARARPREGGQLASGLLDYSDFALFGNRVHRLPNLRKKLFNNLVMIWL